MPASVSVSRVEEIAKAAGIATTSMLESRIEINKMRAINCPLLVKRGVRVSRREIKPRVMTSVAT